MKYLLILITVLMLSGCPGTMNTPGIIQKQVHVDSKMLEACEPIGTTTIVTIDDVLRENISLYGKYAICARKQDDSIKLIKSFADIKE